MNRAAFIASLDAERTRFARQLDAMGLWQAEVQRQLEMFDDVAALELAAFDNRAPTPATEAA